MLKQGCQHGSVGVARDLHRADSAVEDCVSVKTPDEHFCSAAVLANELMAQQTEQAPSPDSLLVGTEEDVPDLASVALPLATALPEEDDFEWLENGVEAAQHLGNLGVQSDTAQEVLPTYDETEAKCSQVTADLTAVFEEITGYLEQAVTLPEAGEFLSEGPRDEPVSPLAEAGAPLGQHVFTSITWIGWLLAALTAILSGFTIHLLAIWHPFMPWRDLPLSKCNVSTARSGAIPISVRAGPTHPSAVTSGAAMPYNVTAHDTIPEESQAVLAEEGTGHKSLWAPQDSIWNEEEELGAVPVIVQQLQDEVLQAKIQCQQEKSRADTAEAQRNEQQRVSDLLQGHSTKAEEHINQMVKELQQA